MSNANYHLSESKIPKGYQIYEDRLEVMGIQHRRENAAQFAKGKPLALELEREPNNEHDPKAVKIMGISHIHGKTYRIFLGYLPRKVAAPLVDGGYVEMAIPRLLKTYVSNSGYVEILLQILGPKKDFQNYKNDYSKSYNAYKASRSVNLSVAAEDELSNYNPSTQKHNIWLYLGVFFAPHIFCWFLLKKEYSTLSRVLGFGWMIILTIGSIIDKG